MPHSLEPVVEKTNTILTHQCQLWKASYSRCGGYLIASGYDATLQRWDLRAETPQLMEPILGHHGWVQNFDFLGDTSRMCSADSWGMLSCWDYTELNAGPVWSNPQAHPGWIRAVAASPDGSQLATGGNDTRVCLWHAETGKLLDELPHPDRVYSLCFAPDGKSLVTGDRTGQIRHWNLETLKHERTLSAQSLFADEAVTKERIQQCGGVRCLSFDASGSRLVCGGQKEPQGGFAKGTPCVIVFDWESGKQIREMPFGKEDEGFAYDAQFHPDGFVMATASAFPGKGQVCFWDPAQETHFYLSTKLSNGRSLSLHPERSELALLTSVSRNGNGRPLKDGQYLGGTAQIRIMPLLAQEATKS